MEKKERINNEISFEEFLNLIKYLLEIDEKRKAEVLMLEALDHLESEFERWTLMIYLTTYYGLNHMYLKMRKVARQMINEFPDNYAGYHAQYMVEIERKHYKEALKYLELIPDTLKKHPKYYEDYLDVCEKIGDYDKLIVYIDNHDEIIQMIPVYALKKKILAYNKMGKTKKIAPLLLILAAVFDDMDAEIAVMALLFFDENFKESAIIAKHIIDVESENKTYRAFIAYTFQIHNLYIISKRKPSDQAKKFMKKALQWIKEYLQENDTDLQEYKELIEFFEYEING